VARDVAAKLPQRRDQRRVHANSLVARDAAARDPRKPPRKPPRWVPRRVRNIKKFILINLKNTFAFVILLIIK